MSAAGLMRIWMPGWTKSIHWMKNTVRKSFAKWRPSSKMNCRRYCCGQRLMHMVFLPGLNGVQPSANDPLTWNVADWTLNE